jgi:AAA domain
MRNVETKPRARIQQATDATLSPWHRILLVGPTGSGKSAQIWTLPGKKFAFVFDPNTATTIKGCPNLDFAEFLPEFMEMDTALKGFNKGSKSDKTIGRVREPRLYEDWREWMNEFVETEAYAKYDWLIFDSHTFLAKAMMDRQLFINSRYGETEELADFKVVGGKFSDIFSRVNGLPINIFSTGHLQTYEDDKTKKIVTQLYLPGRARTILPLSHTNVWEAQAGDVAGTWEIKTLPEKRGLQDIRTSIPGLKPVEDVTIKNFGKAEEYGVGRLLRSATHGKSQAKG